MRSAPGAAPGAAARRAVVFVNGEYAHTEAAFYAQCFADGDLRLAADGGYAAARALGLRPDVLVGDFDSLSEGTPAAAATEGVEIVRLPVRKDETDTEAAVGLALRRGAAAVDLLGAFGGAPDHELGNVAVLRRLAARGVAARLLAPALSAAVLCPSRTTLSSPPGTRVSLLSLSESALVTLAGLEYPLERGLLHADSCLGVGNAVRRADARIEVHEGEVLALVFAPGEAFAAVAESD